MAASFRSQLRKAYKAAKRDLNELLRKQQELEKQLVIARQTVNSLEHVCKEAGLKVESSSDAAYLLQKSALGDEIRSILIANYPAWMRPNQVLAELERIGHDLSKMSNPQASVQMILKRMVQGEEAQEGAWDGKKVYRVPRTVLDTEQPTLGMRIADIPERRASTLRLSNLLTAQGLNLEKEKLPPEIRASFGVTDAAVPLKTQHERLRKILGER